MSWLRALLSDVSFLYHRARHSFWFLPGLMGLASLLILALTLWLDYRVSSGFTAVRSLPFWFSGTPSATRNLLSTIATVVGTMTTIVFSITVLALQLASSQYTPRLLLSFTKSAVSQATLGIFISTVLYSILVLSTVRDAENGQGLFVPDVSVNMSKALAVLSLGMLIYFISHVANLISPSNIVRSAREQVEDAYQSYVQDKTGEDAPPQIPPISGRVEVIRADQSGYVQHIRHAKLGATVRRLVGGDDEFEVRMATRVLPGDYVKPGDTLAELVTEYPLTPSLRKSARKAFVLGPSRIPETDVRYGIDELHSIALQRVNVMDAMTVKECVAVLTEAWLSLMKRPLYSPNRWITLKSGRMHLSLVPLDTDTQFVMAFESIRQATLKYFCLPEVASAVHEALATVAREAAGRNMTRTLQCVWPELITTTEELIASTKNSEYMARVVRALLPLKKVLDDGHEERWPELESRIRRAVKSEDRPALRAILDPEQL